MRFEALETCSMTGLRTPDPRSLLDLPASISARVDGIVRFGRIELPFAGTLVVPIPNRFA